MEYKITGYKPEKLFHFFEEISAIPRGSGNEKGISDYLVKFAHDRGLWVYQDDAYNVIIKKGGSKGAENRPAVMLQGHIDMVCEKVAGVEHDFEKEGLDLVVEDGVLTANGTTLGADNGVAVALMLMVLDDEAIVHPPVECVFTTEEEVGLNGARALDKSQISARTMINMDSEEEGMATISCAGGLRIECTRPVVREKAEGTLLTIEISGLKGGHSGTDIDKERQNAIRVMARMLYQLMKNTDGKLVAFSGGNKDNAIPRECMASNGVQSRNMKLDGFVVVSTNMGVVRAEDDRLVIVFSPRSSVASLQEEMKARLGLLAETFGFTATYSGEYPGWSYKEESPIREVFLESYRELFGEELKTEALHAGLECGLFSDAVPGLDAIAVGPTLNNVHTPEENLPLDSFERFYELLKDVLRRLTEK